MTEMERRLIDSVPRIDFDTRIGITKKIREKGQEKALNCLSAQSVCKSRQNRQAY